MEKKKCRLIIVESSSIITLGLKEILKQHSEFEIVACHTDVAHYMERINTVKCDMVLVNPTLFSYTKRTNVRSIFSAIPDVSLVALIYSYIDAEVIKQYNGSIQINDDNITVIKKLKQVIEHQQENVSTNDGDELSDREQEILTSVAKGMTNKEIADLCNISIHTVISHRKNITRKTGIKTVSGLTVYALLNNLIDQSDME